MRFDIFTLFPQVFEPYLQTSILNRAIERGLIEVHLHNIRDWTTDRHHVTDDEPYGGGGGMVMKAEPIFAAVEAILGSPPACPVILLTPQGRPFTMSIAQELASQAREHQIARPQIALLCGRYEGVDERVRQYLISDEISMGDYVLTGGELPALVVVDVVARLIPGVLGDPEGPWKDSYTTGLLEHPHYTRPATFRGWDVPDVLRSGDHARIDRWRRDQALKRTWERRPDLLELTNLSEEDKDFLNGLQQES